MIESFKHKGLRQLFEDDNARGVNSDHVAKLKVILTVMNTAREIGDLDVATFRLHALTGNVHYRARELEGHFQVRSWIGLGCRSRRLSLNGT